PGEERLRQLVVLELLVDRAAPRLVDPDHGVTGDREHADEAGVLLDRLLQRDGAHPGVVHVAQLGAESGGDVHEVALVADRGTAAVDGHVEEVAAQLDVVGEAAGGEDDRLAGAERDTAAVGPGGLHADHASARTGQGALHTVAGKHLHA